MGRTGRTTIQGKYGDTLKIVAVDTDGQIVSVIKGTDASGNVVTILVDAAGKMLAVMQGDYAGTPKTLAVDSDGRMQAILYGTYGATPTAIAVDEGGKLVVQNLAQTNIEGDLTEAQTYDSPVSNLLNNMNRIRNQIIAITGEAWGTVTRSTLTIWAKFHATTGHKHTGAADDAPLLTNTAIDAAAAIAGTKLANTPAGTIAATTVQAALNELDTEKETPAGAQTKVDTHQSVTNPHSSTAAATASRLMLRDAAGRCAVVAPSASTDIALKSTVTDDIGTHAALATGIHGAGASTVATAANIATHAALMLNPAVHPTPVATKTTTYTASSTDSLILADATSAAFVITLPTAVGITGKVYDIQKIDSSVNTVTIDGNGTETINGDLTQTMSYQYDSITIISDNTNWRII